MISIHALEFCTVFNAYFTPVRLESKVACVVQDDDHGSAVPFDLSNITRGQCTAALNNQESYPATISNSNLLSQQLLIPAEEAHEWVISAKTSSSEAMKHDSCFKLVRSVQLLPSCLPAVNGG